MEKKKKANRPTATEKNLKKIGRGFSMSNVQLVQQARDKLVIEEKEVDENTLEKLALTARRSFVLPDISQFGKVLAAFIREDLISATAMTALTTKGMSPFSLYINSDGPDITRLYIVLQGW